MVLARWQAALLGGVVGVVVAVLLAGRLPVTRSTEFLLRKPIYDIDAVTNASELAKFVQAHGVSERTEFPGLSSSARSERLNDLVTLTISGPAETTPEQFSSAADALVNDVNSTLEPSLRGASEKLDSVVKGLEKSLADAMETRRALTDQRVAGEGVALLTAQIAQIRASLASANFEKARFGGVRILARGGSSSSRLISTSLAAVLGILVGVPLSVAIAALVGRKTASS